MESAVQRRDMIGFRLVIIAHLLLVGTGLSTFRSWLNEGTQTPLPFFFGIALIGIALSGCGCLLLRGVKAKPQQPDATDSTHETQPALPFAALVENSQDFICMAQRDGAILYLNPAGRRMVGGEALDGVPAQLAEYFTEESARHLCAEALPLAWTEGQWEGELQLRHLKSGRAIDAYATLFPVASAAPNQPDYLALTLRDITERKWFDDQINSQILHVQEARVELETRQQELALANRRLEEMNTQLETLATTDGLTGLKNHRAFQERLADEHRRSARYQTPLSVVLLDVDHFKTFNDTFGHPAGDAVLRRVAELLQASARQTDYVARYGGEEFVVVLPETGSEGAMVVAERIRAAIEGATWAERPITVSVGVSALTLSTETAANLVAQADEALYLSKRNGRNRATLFAPLFAEFTQTTAN